MKLSIENFKSIKVLHNFEIKPITVLSGINSAGKSSFIQFLLLIKQTLEDSSSKKVLSTSGTYYTVGNEENLFNNLQTGVKKIRFGLNFCSSEFDSISFPELGVGDYEVDCSIEFQYFDKHIKVSDFSVKLISPESVKKNFVTISLQEGGQYVIQSDSELYGKGLMGKSVHSDVDFVAFFPLSFTFNNEPTLFKIDWLKDVLNLIFKNFFYIGPVRKNPEESYVIVNEHLDVGIEGQYVSQVLKEMSDHQISFTKMIQNESGVTYETDKTTLLDAIKHWLSDTLDIAESIHSENDEDSYRIFLQPKRGKGNISIKHVGFGISQILPILVQGLILPENGILVIEQPEIHLHPKIQSLLYDFLYGLTLQGKTIIVETHSSHFITRMRRRIAEDVTNQMDENIQLTFIEENLFRTLEIDDYGTILNYYPKDFIEHPTEEMKAIIEAQIRKRKAND